jgi:hypothetical protein
MFSSPSHQRSRTPHTSFHRMSVIAAAAVTSISWNVDAFLHSSTMERHPEPSVMFHIQQQQLQQRFGRTISVTSLPMSQQDDDNLSLPNDNHHFSSHDADILQQRLSALHLEILEKELSRPPNAHLDPIQVVKAIMEGLWNSYDPLPDSGFRLLLHSSTPKWRREILKSLGVPMMTQQQQQQLHDDEAPIGQPSKRTTTINISSPHPPKNKSNNKKKIKKRMVDYEVVASALGSSMGRPHNQFAILVGEGDEEYVLDFSASESQLLDFGDGTCWVECRLRDKTTDELLVLTGWDLVRRDDDGAWMVDWIYWQDFREEFRPGIGGRQEWLVSVRD